MSIGADTPAKLQRVRTLLRDHMLDGVWLRHHANVAWLCDGSRTHIHLADDAGVVSLFVTADQAHAVTNDIEHARLRDEEGMQHWSFISTPWAAPAWTPRDPLPPTAKVGCDLPGTNLIEVPVAALRTPLLPAETQRLRALGAEVSASLFAAVSTLAPNQTEHVIAGVAARAVCDVGAEPVVVLVAGDARIARVRHPLPGPNPVKRVAMIVICARRHGLVMSMTRFVAWGTPPDDLEAKLTSAAYIDACAIAQTRPGRAMSQIWTAIQNAYAHVGHPTAWHGLHQGGPCSYAPRDALLTPDARGHVRAMQAFAWNPAIPGAKSEDTLLCTDAGNELLTLGPWPTQSVAVDAATWLRPALLRL